MKETRDMLRKHCRVFYGVDSRTVFWLVKSTVPTAMLNGAKSFTVLKTLILCRVVQNCYVVYIFCKIYS